MDAPVRLLPILNAQTVVPVLLAGGSGTRLWPLSREKFPKQFHALIGDDANERSLFQQTASRCAGIDNAGDRQECINNQPPQGPAWGAD